MIILNNYNTLTHFSIFKLTFFYNRIALSFLEKYLKKPRMTEVNIYDFQWITYLFDFPDLKERFNYISKNTVIIDDFIFKIPIEYNFYKKKANIIAIQDAKELLDIILQVFHVAECTKQVIKNENFNLILNMDNSIDLISQIPIISNKHKSIVDLSIIENKINEFQLFKYNNPYIFEDKIKILPFY